MIDSVHDYPLSQIFDKDANRYYYIPKYQREYTWSYSHWNTLYDDIKGNADGYFIGSIICINDTKDSFSINKLEVVDGQQRLTTLSILLAAIYSHLVQYKDYISDDDVDILPSIKKSLRKNNSPNGLVLQPQVQNSNADDYSFLMQEKGILDITKFPKKSAIPYYPHRKIGRCFSQFYYRIEIDIKELDISEKVKKLIEFYQKVNHAVLVKIEVKTHNEAYMLFESLNDRGTPLTAIDLMKNTILSKARNDEEVNLFYEQWKTLIESLTSDYRTQERFFRHYYNSFKLRHNEPFVSADSRSKEPLGIIATKSNLLAIYEKLINHDLSFFLNDISYCGKLYSYFIDPIKEAPSQFRDALLDLLHIQAAPANILLLYLFYYKEKLHISDKKMISIIQLMVRFFVRRNITDTPNTYMLDRIFMGIIADINLNKDMGEDEIYNVIYSTILSVSAPEESFIEKLSGNIYDDNVGVARFLLCKLSEKYMTTEHWTDLWKQNDTSQKKIYVWTIEHIFPEGENIPQCWVDMIADGNKELAKQYREDYVHKIGNLTISGFNSALGNKSFEEKKERKNKEGNYIGYKNGLEINKDIAEKDRWTIDDIKERTNKLVDILVAMFRL